MLSLGVSSTIDYIYADDSRETTRYFVECQQAIQNGNCPGGWTRAELTTYIVNPDDQTGRVFRSDPRPLRYQECAIVDKEHWTCDIQELDDFRGFAKGKFSPALASPGSDTHIKEVSRREWTFTKNHLPRE